MGIIVEKKGIILSRILKAMALAAVLLPAAIHPQPATAAAITCSNGITTGCHFNTTVTDGTARNVPAGTFPGSHGKHAGSASNQYGFACTKCHPSASYSNSHQNGFKNLTGSSLPANAYAPGRKIADSNSSTGLGSCSNTYCHSTVQGTNGTGVGVAQTTPAWGTSNTLNCGSCHVDMSGTGGTGSHAKHAGSSGYKLACDKCHTGYTSTTPNYTNHVNGSIDVALSPGSYSGGAANEPGGGYGSCSGVYCHSTGQTVTPVTAPLSTPTWGASLTCGGCHGNSSATLTTGSHGRHLGSVTCDRCHALTAANNNTLKNAASYGYHDNGQINIAFELYSAATAGALYGGAATPLAKTPNNGTSFGSCTNITCHSNGTAIWSNAVGTGSTPTWGQAGGCNACHGNSAFSDWRKGFPLYTSYPTKVGAKPNAHARHLDVRATSAGPTCANCHATVTASNTAIDGSNAADHANGSYNVTGGGTFLNGDSVNTAAVAVTLTATLNKSNGTVYTTCSNVSCHPTGLAAKTATNTRWNDRDNCTECHKVDLQNNSGNNGYHHAMSNYSSGTGYPTAAPQGNADGTALPKGAAVNPANRRCTMCHVKHDIFSPLRNANVSNRANMLRSDIAVTPTAGSGYANTDFIKTPGGTGGICISCHNNSLTKSRVLVKFDNTSSTVQVTLANYSASAHQYAVANALKHTGDTGAFQANCTKCHNGRNGEVAVFTAMTTANHDNSRRRLLASIGGASNVDGNDSYFCYGCHTGAAAGQDYYKTQSMSLAARSIQTVFNDAFAHPVNSNPGIHRPEEEGRAANNGTMSGANRHVSCNDCHDPHSAKPIAAGLTAGSVTAFTTGTPDTVTDSSETGWTTNQWTGYTVRITEGTGAGQESVIYGNTSAGVLYAKFVTAPAVGSKYIIYGKGTPFDGNMVRNTQLSVWGVNPTWPAQPTPPAWNDNGGVGGSTTAVPDIVTTAYSAISAWNRTENATIQGQICIKCHSAYAFGTTLANFPLSPSGLPNSSGGTTPTTAGAKTMHESDVANDFNPNNLAYHPVFARGKNQPVRANYNNPGLTSVCNTNWPKYTGSTITVANGVATLTGGTVPKSILPGWFILIGSTTLPTTPTAGSATTGFLEITNVNSNGTLNVRAETGGTWPNVTYTSSINIGTAQACAVTPGLGATFVAPWGPWSLMRCTDCHESDTASDPLGPHGSAQKYLLKKATAQSFMTINSTGVDTVVTQPYTPDPFHFCHNCHRMDVYGGGYSGGYLTAPGSANLSRQPHPVDRSTADTLKTRSMWGTVCQNCHGGARVGEIHGSNLGKGTGSGGTGTSNSGQRLLAGATWAGVTRSTTTNGSCYLKGATDTVSNCSNTTSSGSAFGGGTVTYNY